MLTKETIKSFFKLKEVKNAGWIIAGKIAHIALSFVIGLITARYLGPSNYGLINYAGAYTAFFTVICTLGINSVIMKNFFDYPDEVGTSIGTTLVLRLAASFLSIGMIATIISIVDKGEKLTLIIVVLYSVGLIFQSFDSFRQWFQSRLQSKYYAIATLISYLIASAYRIVLLITRSSVEWFALSNSVDFLVVAVFLYIFYKKNQGPSFAFSWGKAKQLLSQSVSYILAGLMTAIYASSDKIMLKHFVGESSVGYYALAASVSSLGVFILSAITESLSPGIMQSHNTDKEKYILSNKRLYSIIFYLAVSMSLVLSVIAPLFIRIVYGEAYLPAVGPLRIIAWYTAFAYLDVSRNVWIVCEKKQKYLKYIYFFSALLNIVLNILLIPSMNAEGAAVASLATQFAALFLFPLLFKGLRPNVQLMLEAISLRDLINRIRTDRSLS